MKEKICITLDTTILKEIDNRRGIIPRATYLNEEIRKTMIAPVPACKQETGACQ